MPVIKAAAVQLSPVLYSREGTVAKVVRIQANPIATLEADDTSRVPIRSEQ